MEYKTIALSFLLVCLLPALAFPAEEVKVPAVHQQVEGKQQDKPVPSQAADRKDVGVEASAPIPADARVDESEDKSDLETANTFWSGYSGYYPSYSGWRRGWGSGYGGWGSGYGGYGGNGGYGGYGGYRGYRGYGGYGGYGGWGNGYSGWGNNGGYGWRNHYWR